MTPSFPRTGVSGHAGAVHTAAHEIVSISEDRITKDGGLLPEQLLKILARETGADLTLYDRLNDEIIRQIDMAPLG
ncbi:hypothetical protein ACNJHT_20745 [Mycobacterium tuberculosis]